MAARRPGRKLRREEAEGGIQMRQEGAWPRGGEDGHLPKKSAAHWMSGHYNLLCPL